MKKIKIAIWSINVFLVAIVIFLALGKGTATEPKYTTYTVKSQDTNYFTGVVQADEKNTVSAEPKSTDEVLASTQVTNGQKVMKGQTIFSFYEDMSGEINSVNLEIKQINLSIQEANKNTTKSVDDQIELAKDQQSLADAQDKLNKLNKQQNRVVTAPISGTYYKDSEGNSYIYGNPVILGNVNEFSLDKVKVGKDVTVVKNNGKEITGTYSQKDAIPYNKGAVSYYHFQVSTEETLPYGMHVQIKNKSLGYKIPASAVKDEDTVYLLKKNKKHKIILNLTKHGNDYYTKENIKAGDKLVLF